MKNRLRVLRAERDWSQQDLADKLGVSRQTIMQRVKRGELTVVHVSRGKQKGLRIRVLDHQPQLFDSAPSAKP